VRRSASLRTMLCLLVVLGLALATGCNFVSSVDGSAETEDSFADAPTDSDLTSIGPEGETRIFYQFVDEQRRVRFVERLEDVPARWRDRVGYVELAEPPPLSPAEARRASRADATAANDMRAATRSVVLYSADWCGYCRKAKRHLEDRGVPYELRDVDIPAAKEELLARTGGKGIPVLDLDGRILRGYSRGSYDDLLDSVGL
jgi:glutaredoxin